MLVYVKVDLAVNYFFFFCFFLFQLLVTSLFSIHHLTSEIILTQYQQVKDQIDTSERLWTILIYSIKVRDQICNLPKKFKKKKKNNIKKNHIQIISTFQVSSPPPQPKTYVVLNVNKGNQQRVEIIGSRQYPAALTLAKRVKKYNQ